MAVKKVFIALCVWLLILTCCIILKDNKKIYQDVYGVKLTGVNWCIVENGTGYDIKGIKVKVKNDKVYVKLVLWNGQEAERQFDRERLLYIDYI